MSKFTPSVALVFMLAVFMIGCEARPVVPIDETLAYAPMRAQEMLSSERESQVDITFTPPTPEQKAGPRVEIEARFLAADPSLLARHLAFKPEETHKIITQSEADRITKQLQDHHMTRTLTAPRLTVFSSQRAYVVVGKQSAFVHDMIFEPASGGKGGTFKPVVDTIPTGVLLDVAAQVDGDTAVFTRLAAKDTRLVGMRLCSVTIIEKGKRSGVFWQEAILMDGICPIKNPCKMHLRDGEVLVAPLTFKVRQTSANARAYFPPGYVRESVDDATGTTLNPGSRPALAGLQQVVLLKVRVIQPKPDAK